MVQSTPGTRKPREAADGIWVRKGHARPHWPQGRSKFTKPLRPYTKKLDLKANKMSYLQNLIKKAKELKAEAGKVENEKYRDTAATTWRRNSGSIGNTHVLSYCANKLETYRLPTDANSIYCIPDYVDEAGEQALCDFIADARTQGRSVKLRDRSVQVWGGDVTPTGLNVGTNTLPPILDDLTRQMACLGIFPENITPNHVLINDYPPNGGIMPHCDGPAYFPIAAILSLGSSVVMDFTRKVDELKTGLSNGIFSVFVPSRSLLVFKEEIYTSALHGIDTRSEDELSSDILNVPQKLAGKLVPRGFRKSLTIRHVPFVEPSA